MSNRSSAALCLLAALVGLSGAAQAGSIGLQWDPLAGASGYRVHYGTSPGSYTEVRDVGPATQTTLTGLDDCTVYYVAVKAYNGQGVSAEFSNQVSGWSRPQIGGNSPTGVVQGDRLTLTINGANFQPGAQLDYQVAGVPSDAGGNPLVRLENVSVVSCNAIEALLTVEPTARGQRAMEIGDFDLSYEVVNPDSVFGSGAGTLSVGFGETRADINRTDSGTTDRVDGKDLVWLAYSFGTSEGEPKHNPDSDLTGDGTVDGNDLVFLATRFGKCWNGSAWTACP